MNIIKFSLPLPPSLNQYLGLHWAARGGIKDEIYADTYVEIRRHFKEAIPDWGKIYVKFTIFSNRFMDKDNRVVVVKTIVDAIKNSGLIKNDTEEYIDYELPGLVLDPKNPERRVKVEITKEG